MAMIKLLITLAGIAATLASPPEPERPRNTIFNDEKLQGELFEAVDVFSVDELLLKDDSDNPYRLPTTTKPINYNIYWAIDDFTSFLFSGTVTIRLTATEPNVNEIVIHSEELSIMPNYALTDSNNNAIAITMTEVPEYQFLKFTLTTGTLVPDAEYTLTINFFATLRNDMYGIYRSWYTTQNEIKYMASTQYQATSARKAFPCYDEPSFKAYFNITIRRPSTYRSWSCTKIAETTNSLTVANTQEDRYETTPLMSTYLIALIVAEYASIENKTNDVLTYEVIARPDAIADGQGQYAFEVGQELLAAMSEHTGIDFFSVDPNLKMTQAAIPDFSAGAMENWGLLTYREAYLMFSEEHSSYVFKHQIAVILSHEIAHMWFGNLVTCDWWDVLWLNEGFARYYQYFLTHWVEDYMGLDTRFITDQVHTSLLSDAANSPHALTNPGIGSPAAVSAMFSTLTYNKGACIIRMTEHLLGFEVHRQGLKNYLTKFSFGTVKPGDLFETLQEAAVAAGAISEYGTNFSIVDYYKTWTEQPSAPVLNVQVNHQTGQITITQRRFNINTGYSANNGLWIVPITFATASNPDFVNTKPTHIIKDTVTVIDRGTVGDEWVVFNKQQTGYYRVNYDDYTWDLISIALRGPQRTVIHEYNRAQIVNDVFQFARSGLMTYTRAFNILSFLENETDFAPWVAAMTGFSWIRNRFAGIPTLAPLEAMITQWATTVINDIGYDAVSGESFMRAYLRYQLAPVMCNMGVQACRTSANSQFAALRATPSVEVNVNNRFWVYCNALRDGSVDDFNFLWNRFLTHHVYNEKLVLLQTLGCTPHQSTLNTLLDAIVQENQIIRPQDYAQAWSTAVNGNEGNTQIVFQYVQANLAQVETAFEGIASPLSYVSARLRTEAEVNEFQTWATNNQNALGNSYNAVYNGAENSRASIQWSVEVASDFEEFFNTGVLPLETSTAPPTTTTDPVTEPQPIITEPPTPELPSSAVRTFVSVFAMVFAVLAGVMA